MHVQFTRSCANQNRYNLKFMIDGSIQDNCNVSFSARKGAHTVLFLSRRIMIPFLPCIVEHMLPLSEMQHLEDEYRCWVPIQSLEYS